MNKNTLRVAQLACAMFGMVIFNHVYAYMLPYPAGTSYEVTQGNNGSKSHSGMEQYAFDFGMSEGREVRAIAAGTVSLIRMNSTKSKCDKAYANDANYVVIDHGNGQSSLYLHLQANSSTLKVGNPVVIGQFIGKSGKTGYSCGPHLHFQVQQICGSWYCQSVPTTFDDVGGTPQKSQTYTSKNVTDSTVSTPKNHSTGNSWPTLGFSWKNNNSTSVISSVEFTLREADRDNGTAGTYVGTCGSSGIGKSIGINESYSSSSCGASLKRNQWYKWAVTLNFNNNGSSAKGFSAYFQTKQ